MSIKCIIKFLSDMNQRYIRRLAQTQSDNYETSLENYKKLFVSNYQFYFAKSKECTEFGNCKYHSLCKEIMGNLESIEKGEIEDFFNTIKNIYILWINADWEKALEAFEQLLNSYGLFKFDIKNAENEVFYKGRVDKNILTTWDMFHIPFNKRYLIKNQRYSITGQPLIYVGLSIIDIVEELEVKEKDIEFLKSSTYKLPETMKIYDLRNNIYGHIIDNSIESMFTDSESVDYKAVFYRNILSSICSFEKRREHKDYHFCEEYVLPQIFAQILKKHKFDGVRYISTKKFNGLKISKNGKLESGQQDDENRHDNVYEESINDEIINNYKTLYKENLALFTNIDYKVSDVYDKGLYGKIKISKPLDIHRLEEISLEDLNEILNEVEFFKNKMLYNEASSIYEKFKREFACIEIDGKKYLDLSVGKIHINHIHILMSSILQECMESEEKYE